MILSNQVDSAFYPPWDGKMSSNSFIWVTEDGDLSTADWGCLLPSRPMR